MQRVPASSPEPFAFGEKAIALKGYGFSRAAKK
jgi:hypothetical protein